MTQHEHFLAGIPQGAVPLALSALLEGSLNGAPAASAIIHVAANDRAMEAVAEALAFFAPHAPILRFPAWDCLPYDRVSPRAGLVAERVQTLAQLAMRTAGAPLVVLTTASAIVQKLPPVGVLRESVFALKPGARVDREKLTAFLLDSGYRRAGKAIEPGEFALRGSIIDIITPASSAGLRLDFFGDELESLRYFDPMTQISSGTATAAATLHPAGEVPTSETRIAQFRAGYRERFGAVSKEDPLYESISSGQRYPGMEHWLPLFYDGLSTLADYVPDAALTFDAGAEKSLSERQETILDYYDARQSAKAVKGAGGAVYHPLPPEALYVMQAAWALLLEKRTHYTFTPFFSAELGARSNLGWRAAPNFVAQRVGTDTNPFDQLKEWATDKRAQGKATVLAALSAGSAERLSHLLMERHVHPVRVADFAGARNISGKSVGLAVLPLTQGFETETLLLVTEQDLLGERIIRAKAKKRSADVFLAEAANFQEGELVVHREHGIGKFAGLVTLEVSGAKHDCLKLVYADDDKLFLPVENIDLLSRFGAEEEGAKLDKLGAASWQARKARMKERIKIAAEALMKTAAERLVKTAPVLEAFGDKYEAFCAGFGFVETEDQARSIDEVVEDLAAGRPMDRLICGDVGFGKTEVALRAAFVATHSHPKMQVAVVVPTTLLARQHYRNFAERFAHTGLVVRQLSRMVPAKAQKETKEQLATGAVDIVVGTHALLSKTIRFNNLGLLVVDEEQHFGVGQKEKLKELKADVHVLTLSATPIPRTLQLALSGVRSLSLITTPPVDRLAVRSFVMPFDPVVIREAILRERHRGGRTFVVTPRIKDIGELKVKLTELLPEINIAVAHGQLAPGELDDIMNAFYEGKYDVLLSTAIIESGLDIPQANTMIIHRADRFGLGQLYQLRGRVGRGKLRAYAYFILPARQVSTDANRRLEVMQSLDTLGAGFQLASHDMDIRGFGNLVGEEQTGHVREVGIELYQQMLEEAVEALKRVGRSSSVVGSEERQTTDDQRPTDYSPQINLGMSVLIPEAYVEDLSLRMGLYRRAGDLHTPAEIDAFAAELIDRFGPLPEEVEHLLSTVRIKQLCRAAGIARIDAGPKGAVIGFWQDSFEKPEKLLAHIGKHPTALKLRPDQKLVYLKEWKTPEARMQDVSKLLAEVAELRG